MLKRHRARARLRRPPLPLPRALKNTFYPRSQPSNSLSVSAAAYPNHLSARFGTRLWRTGVDNDGEIDAHALS